MPLMDNLLSFDSSTNSDTDTDLDPIHYTEIDKIDKMLSTDWKAIVGLQAEINQEMYRWDALMLLYDIISSVYGHVCTTKEVTPALLSFVDKMEFTGHSSFISIGTENIHTLDGFKAGCEGLISTIVENIKKFFKWLWEKIKAFFAAVKEHILKILKYLGLVEEDKKKDSGMSMDDKVAAIAKMLNDPRGTEASDSINTQIREIVVPAVRKILNRKLETIDKNDVKKLLDYCFMYADTAFNYISDTVKNGTYKNTSSLDLHKAASIVRETIVNRESREFLKLYDELSRYFTIRSIPLIHLNVFLNIDPRLNDGRKFDKLWKQLVFACRNATVEADNFISAYDSSYNNLLNKINNKISTDIKPQIGENFTSNNNIQQQIVIAQRMMRSLTLVVMSVFQKKIPILKEAVREYQQIVSKVETLTSLDPDADLIGINLEPRILSPTDSRGTYDGIRIYKNDLLLQKSKTIKNINEINAAVVSIAWPALVTNSDIEKLILPARLIILISTGLDNLDDKGVYHWILTHEIAHIKYMTISDVIRGLKSTKLTYFDITGTNLVLVPIKQFSSHDMEYNSDEYSCRRYGLEISERALNVILDKLKALYPNYTDRDSSKHPSFKNRIAHLNDLYSLIPETE